MYNFSFFSFSFGDPKSKVLQRGARVTLAPIASWSQPDNVGCLKRLRKPRGYKLKWRVDTSFIGAKSPCSPGQTIGQIQRGIGQTSGINVGHGGGLVTGGNK